MRVAFVIFLPLAILISCSPPELQRIHLQGEAQGTYYSIIYFDPNDVNYGEEIDQLLSAYNRSVSLYDTSSIICRINRNDPHVVIDSLFLNNFNIAMKVAQATGGAFDFTIGQLVNAWGFGLKNRESVDSAMIDSLKKTVGYHKVQLTGNRLTKEDPRTLLDFNAVAQGYSVDMAGLFLESKGIRRYLVDIGGEVLTKGRKENDEPWSVGIELPVDDPNPTLREVTAVVRLEDKALATSGNYRKFYVKDGVKYSHTIDPQTGYPVTHSLLSASVFATTAAEADAFATAFMVMGLEKTIEFLKTHPALGAYLIYADPEGQFKTFITDNTKSLIEEKN